ncbi:MAG: ABC transporter substrate-binding protein, partial [Dehalococcoidia bacterium]
GRPVELRVGAVADTYRNDPKDMSRLNIGMYPLNVNIFDQLVLVDHEFQLQPMLAESWEYIKETGTWRFHLRKGVKFHDGQPLTAQAVVQMVQRFWSQGRGGHRLRIDENSAVAVDDYTVDITPVSPHLRLPEELAHSSYGVRAPGSDPLKGEHVGTGPFKFVEYVNDDHITAAKNAEYWGLVPAVDRIELRFMPDPNTRILALQAGDVDAIFDVPPEATSLLEGRAEIQVLPTDVSASQYIMVLLTGEEPYNLTQDILVREALGYAIDRQAILDISFDGFAAASQLFSPPGVLGQYADRIVGYNYDPDRARTLLEEAGWKDADGDGIREKSGRKLTLEFINGFPAGPENGQTAEVVQAQLREVGIDLKVTNVPDNATYSTLLKDKQGDLFLEIGNQNSPSPCFLASLFYSRYDKPGSYARGFAPGPQGWPEYDDEIDACNAALTTDEAAMHRANAIQILVDESRSLIPLVGITRIYAARDIVKNFDPHPVRLHVRWDSLAIGR